MIDISFISCLLSHIFMYIKSTMTMPESCSVEEGDDDVREHFITSAAATPFTTLVVSLLIAYLAQASTTLTNFYRSNKVKLPILSLPKSSSKNYSSSLDIFEIQIQLIHF